MASTGAVARSSSRWPQWAEVQCVGILPWERWMCITRCLQAQVWRVLAEAGWSTPCNCSDLFWIARYECVNSSACALAVWCCHTCIESKKLTELRIMGKSWSSTIHISAKPQRDKEREQERTVTYRSFHLSTSFQRWHRILDLLWWDVVALVPWLLPALR